MVYEFKCKKCKTQIEIIESADEYWQKRFNHKCNKCNSILIRIFSPPHIITANCPSYIFRRQKNDEEVRKKANKVFQEEIHELTQKAWNNITIYEGDKAREISEAKLCPP